MVISPRLSGSYAVNDSFDSLRRNLVRSRVPQLIRHLELLQNIQTGEEQIDRGEGITHSAARKKALKRIGK